MPQKSPGMTIDIGGEGRHEEAWNINPSRIVTLGTNCGQPIPKLIVARADALPFSESSVNSVILERTPLTTATAREISRVVCSDGQVVLRHVPLPGRDRHQSALQILAGTTQRNMTRVHGQEVLETTILFSDENSRE